MKFLRPVLNLISKPMANRTSCSDLPTGEASKKQSVVPSLPKRSEGVASAPQKATTRYAPVTKSPNTQLILTGLKQGLEGRGLGYFTGGSNVWTECLNLRHRDRKAIFDFLTDFANINPDLALRTPDGDIVPLAHAARLLDIRTLKHADLLCREKAASTIVGELVAASVITLNFWREKTNYEDIDFMLSGLENPYASIIRLATIDDFFERHIDIAEESEQVADWIRFPIDAVYTWVNDEDEEWHATKDAAAKNANCGNPARSNATRRFRNRNEMKYSLRSLEMFAPFIRNIFIVTNGQIPDWLNLDHPQIKLVTHDQIYRNRNHLPTYSSNSIETQLHHIPGLAEHFLYFNDDFMLGDFCTPEDFFFSNGVMKYFPSDQKVFEADVDEEREEYILADANAIRLLKGKYPTFRREHMKHVAYPCRKSFLQKLEDEFQTEFDKCAREKFRSQDGLRPIAYMMAHAAFQENLSMPADITYRYFSFTRPPLKRLLRQLLRSRDVKAFCLNDGVVPPGKIEWTDAVVSEFLAAYFPFKSAYEK